MENWQYTLPYLISFLISIGISVYAWQHRRVAGAGTFALYAFGQAWWTFGAMVEMITPGLNGKIFWDDFQWIGSLTVFTALFYFALQYTGHPYARSQVIRRGLMGLSVLITLSLYSDPLHHLVRTGIILKEGEPYDALIYDFTTFVLLLSLYGYVLTLWGVGLLIRQFWRTQPVYRSQLATVIFGFVLFLIAVSLPIVGITELEFLGQRDISPIAFAIGNIVVAWGLFRYNLFDLVPFARDTVIENLPNAMITLDAQNRVVDLNPAAKRLISASSIGQPLAQIAPTYSEFIQQHADQPYVQQESHTGNSTLELTLSTIKNEQEIVGRLLMITDITERVKIRREIEARRQQAELISEISARMTNATNEQEILAAFNGTLPGEVFTQSSLIYIDNEDDQPLVLETVAAQMGSGTVIPLATLPIIRYRREQFPMIDLILAKPEPLFLENAFEDIRLGVPERAAMKKLGLNASIFMPLKRADQWEGLLIISWATPQTFAPELRQLIIALMPRLADNVAARRAYIEAQRLYAEQVKLVEELKALDAMKSQFLASMSHELRTPLNAILNFTEFMLMGMLGPVTDKQKDALEKTLGSGKHLLALINDVLDMTKIQSGMMKLFIEEQVDLPKEVNAAAAAMDSLLKDKPEVQFVKDIDPDLPKIVGDKRRIRQILLNLLSNAAKFTEQGSVTLAIKKRTEDILFMVSDTGPGIAQEDHDLIFEPFRQTEAGIQHAGGTGLGLPISRKLTEAHGGTLWVESDPGEGATFYFTLPIRSTALLALIKMPEEARNV